MEDLLNEKCIRALFCGGSLAFFRGEARFAMITILQKEFFFREDKTVWKDPCCCFAKKWS